MPAICANTSCHCRVYDPMVYCGPDCVAAAESLGVNYEEMACLCGHPDCYRQSDSSLVSELEGP